MEPITPFLIKFGYAALFAGTALEGESVLLVAGIMTRNGCFDISWVLIIAFAGALTGDLLFFWIGKSGGKTFVARRPKWARRIQRAGRVFEKHQLMVMLTYRFWYGMRGVVPLLIGMSGYDPRRFVILNVAGTILWAALTTWAGYALAGLGANVLNNVRGYERAAFLIIMSVAAAVYFMHKRRIITSRIKKT